MRFEVVFDTGEEEADAEYVALDWQELLAQLEASGILRQVTQIKLLRDMPPYKPPVTDLDDIPF